MFQSFCAQGLLTNLSRWVPSCQILGEPPLDGAAAPVALPLDEVGAIRGGVSSTVKMPLNWVYPCVARASEIC